MKLVPQLDRLPAGYLSFSDQFVVEEANLLLLERLGYALEDVQGKSLNQIVPLAGRILLQTHVIPRLRFADRVDEIYFPMRHRDGQPIPMLLNARKHDRSYECLLFPIQERNEYEDRLREARRLAESALQSRDEFLALVSHELRGPLAVISGYLDLMSEVELEPEETNQALSAMRKNTVLLSRLVEDLLDQASGQVGKLSIRREMVALDEVLHDVVESIRPVAASKNIRLEATIQGNGCVNGDAVRLHQVFWNLLNNAVKFTPRGGCIRVQAQDGQVDVIDDGQGMSAEFLPLVFEPFRQETTGAHSGLGLGLSICKNLVELHAGTLQADSPGPGLGSTFRVWLPTQIADQDLDSCSQATCDLNQKSPRENSRGPGIKS